MNFLVAPCAYKGTFSPIELAESISQAIVDFDSTAKTSLLPLADGGDGTIQSLAYALGGKLIERAVTGPSGKPVDSKWLYLLPKGKSEYVGIIELASASGINYLSETELDALNCQTRGLGQLIQSCLSTDVKEIYITVGGSASTDGGTGVLSELGVQFLDKNNNVLKPCGANLDKIVSIETNSLDPRIEGRSIFIVTDVNNPLCGDNGAAYIYGPQKGADEKQVKLLDDGLKKYASVVESKTGKSLSQKPGAGAAGGVPFGLASIIDASIINGFEWFKDMVDLENQINRADIIITAEGYLDAQTLSGKAIGQLAKLTGKHKKRLWVFPARFEESIDWSKYGIETVCATASSAQAELEDIKSKVKNELIKLKYN